jgi:endonuclease/exonuclease/phosphatase family metal-dependent hydrolase
MRLTSWNLLHGQGAENMRAIAQDLAVGNSDFVIGVQEVDAYQDRSDQVFQVAEIASELSAKYFGFLRCVIGTPGFSWRKVRKDEANLITDALVQSDDKPPSYGIGLITNIPVLKWEVLALGKSLVGLPLAFPDATAGENVRPKIKFIYVKDVPRFALAAQLENGYTVVNMHLSFVPFVNLYQLWKVKRWLAKMPGKHILLGDFNLPFEIPVKFSKWKSLSPMATYPTWQPKIQFDYILSDSKELSSVKAIYLESKISDHLPVTIEIN